LRMHDLYLSLESRSVILSEAKDVAPGQRRFFTALRMTLFLMSAVSAMQFSGCQQKMADQPSFRPLEASSFFSDGRSARPAVAGTVARGRLQTDAAFFTGRIMSA